MGIAVQDMPANIVPFRPRQTTPAPEAPGECAMTGWAIAAFYRPNGRAAFLTQLLCSGGRVHAAYIAHTKAGAYSYIRNFTRRVLWRGDLVERWQYLPIYEE